MHQSLLYDVIKMKNKALEAARQALFSVGIQRFNFDQEIVSRIVSSPLPLETVEGLAQPFLALQQERSWSLLTVFFPQRLSSWEKEEENILYLPEEEEVDFQDNNIQEENFSLIMQQVLQILGENSSLTLKEMLPAFAEGMLQNRSFYDFWLLLHQRSPLTTKEGEERHVLDKALSLLGGDTIEIIEEEEILTLTERYKLQNMRLTRRKE